MSWIHWRGKSLINGESIKLAVTGVDRPSANRDTGPMAQCYIMPDVGMKPTDAVKSGVSRSVCGDCPLRLGACYVNVGQGPNQIERKDSVGGYREGPPRGFSSQLGLRLGAWGDPAAIPIEQWAGLLKMFKGGHTGYTHQWREPRVQPYKSFLMASVDSIDEYHQAQDMGWRTYRVSENGERLPGECICPKSELGGKRSKCSDCLLCDGVADHSPAVKSVTIRVHGLSWKIDHFKGLQS